MHGPNYKLRALLIMLTALGVCGCAFVQVTDAGAGVAQATATDVVNCQDIGEVVATTKDKVVVRRGATKVAQELIDLARNQAASMGANAIVPTSPVENGVQKFRAYLCEDN